MPKLTDNTLEQHTLPTSHYGFSGARIDDLGATEYTLVSIITDVSGSVGSFKNDLEQAVQSVVQACTKSPRADNLLIRFTTFDDRVEEKHGFKLLSNCNVADYAGSIQVGGTTALYDASVNGIDATTAYAQKLTDSDFQVNAIVFVLTDGGDNASKLGPNAVQSALKNAVQSEALESIVSILIGVNVQDASISRYLADYHQQAGFTQYVEIGDASPSTLAKLAEFVSKSISAQSQALGTGGPSQSLTF